MERAEMDASTCAERGVTTSRFEQPVHAVEGELIDAVDLQGELVLVLLSALFIMPLPVWAVVHAPHNVPCVAVGFLGVDQTEIRQPSRFRRGQSKKPQACEPPTSTRQPRDSACSIACSIAFRGCRGRAMPSNNTRGVGDCQQARMMISIDLLSVEIITARGQRVEEYDRQECPRNPRQEQAGRDLRD